MNLSQTLAITEGAPIRGRRRNDAAMAQKETTTTYQWGDGSVIRRIDVRTQSNGRAVAYLYADNSDEKRAERQQFRAMLRQKGWGTLSDFRDGEYALRISGLTNPQALIDLAVQTGLANGVPTPNAADAAPAAAHGLGDTIKNNSLRFSAIGYTLGNILYFVSGIPTKNRERQKMAVAFGVGDAALGIFGGGNDALQYQSLLSKMKSHMERSGIEIPKTASIHVETSTQGESAGTRIGNFMHTHINSIKMAAEVLGGLFAFRSGHGNFKKEKTLANAAEMVGGAVVMAGWSGALLTPEKKPDPETLKDAGAFERFKAYVQEKPTRLAGWAGYCFNLVGGYNFFSKRGTAEGKVGLGAVGMMVGSNTLYAMSHKAPGGDIKTDAMVSDVYIVAAQILNKQPEMLREEAIESTARFLGERSEIKDTRQEIMARLRREMDIQRQSPWFEATPLLPYTPQPKKPRVRVPGLEVADAATDTPKPTVQAQELQHEAPARALAKASIHA